MKRKSPRLHDAVRQHGQLKEAHVRASLQLARIALDVRLEGQDVGDCKHRGRAKPLWSYGHCALSDDRTPVVTDDANRLRRRQLVDQ